MISDLDVIVWRNATLLPLGVFYVHVTCSRFCEGGSLPDPGPGRCDGQYKLVESRKVCSVRNSDSETPTNLDETMWRCQYPVKSTDTPRCQPASRFRSQREGGSRAGFSNCITTGRLDILPGCLHLPFLAP